MAVSRTYVFCSNKRAGVIIVSGFRHRAVYARVLFVRYVSYVRARATRIANCQGRLKYILIGQQFD